MYAGHCPAFRGGRTAAVSRSERDQQQQFHSVRDPEYLWIKAGRPTFCDWSRTRAPVALRKRSARSAEHGYGAMVHGEECFPKKDMNWDHEPWDHLTRPSGTLSPTRSGGEGEAVVGSWVAGEACGFRTRFYLLGAARCWRVAFESAETGSFAFGFGGRSIKSLRQNAN